MNPRSWFSWPAAGASFLAHFVLFALVAVVPDLVMPQLEFERNWVRDVPEKWLLGPSILGLRCVPSLFHETFWFALFSPVVWACLVGLLWAWSRQIWRRKAKMA